uniref:Major facilitator superfamily (MFS) profile domain-containing protein n=1 Tax=Pectinophora gossypiella TaxID=13191 RepID=A0A1E1VXZ2_PECGO
MQFKINRRLLPIKAHFFFFFAALGPILPQLNVFGRQLGVSPEAMGLVTAVLPLLWAAAKPTFGYVVDYWPTHRKLVFMLLITLMTGSYCGLWFIPMPENTDSNESTILEYVYKLNDTVQVKPYHEIDKEALERYDCHWSCSKDNKFEIYLANTSYINTVYVKDERNASCSFLHMDIDMSEERCVPKENCNLMCFEDEFVVNSTLNRTRREVDGKVNNNLDVNSDKEDVTKENNKVRNSEFDKNVDSNTVLSNDITSKNVPVDNESTSTNINTVKTNNNNLTDTSNDINTFAHNTNTETIDQVTSKDVSTPKLVEITSEATVSANTEEIVLNNTATPKIEEVKSQDSDIKTVDLSKDPLGPNDMRAKISKVIHRTTEEKSEGNFYVTTVFWSFVVLMCIGTVAFNVANCIGDAVCFDVLGPENGSKYGSQRAWGTAGYGITALLGGWLVDAVSKGGGKNFTPAFVLALAAAAADLLSCRYLKLPSLSSPDDSGKALREVLKIPRVIVFIIFAVIAGMFDSFIIYYMFWFLEELAEQTGYTDKIKLIEGTVVAGQSFIGEIVFFALSGKIIKRWGYGTTMTLSLFCYGVRMALISLIQHPWHLVFIESVMQGPTYALCYSSIVGYAAHVAPDGYSATVQGIVAGMDDGLGFALGSLLGGQLYGWAGGRGAFRVLAAVAAAAALLHAGMFIVVTRKKPEPPPIQTPEEGEKMLPTESHSNAIYRDTVIPLTEKKANR